VDETFRDPPFGWRTVNLSSSDKVGVSTQDVARPKGEATRVIITEYDLPRPVAQPHDVILDSDGMAWYSDFADELLGKLDPRTGEATEYPIPLLKPGFSNWIARASLRQDENIWLCDDVPGRRREIRPKD